MPTVSMRRTTRVFGLVKGVDGPRVLRSGRRLFPGSDDGKFRRANDGDEWLHTMIKSTINSNRNHNSSSFVKCKENGWTRHCKLKQETNGIVPKRVKSESSPNLPERKKFGVVYARKRKRDGEEKPENSGSKMFGIQFSRRRKLYHTQQRPCLAVSVNSSCSHEFVSFLLLVFGFMRKATLRLSRLASFLSGESVSNAFALSGIRFLQGSKLIETGNCKIFGVRCTVPMFSLCFSAAPCFFRYMHLRLHFSVKCPSLVPVHSTSDEELTSDNEEEQWSIIPKIGNSENKVVLHPSVRASKLTDRHSQYRNGLYSRGIQKRRSSLRRKKARNLSLIGGHKAKVTLVSDLVSTRKSNVSFSSTVFKNKLRSASVVEETRAVDPSSCSANVLVIEPDRCYRVEGAIVTLETTESKEWVVAIKKDGLTRFRHVAQKGMRPCSFNRITHDIMWTGDESWKLEFPNRNDWAVFKDLYKECLDRNMPARPVSPVSKAIPVPRVCEVVGYRENQAVPFARPDLYISVSKDEVARALEKRAAIYDMDSEDEEWLTQFNGGDEPLSEDNFELMIDAFEKALYCSPDDFADEKAAVDICTGLGRREVVEAVYGYWTQKRKQKRLTLIRVFQGHQAKKAPLIPKPVFRKRRSFKRQASQFGRGKQPSLLQAMAAEHDAVEEQNAMRRLEAAENSAKLSVEAAIVRRRYAQRLMENADLLVYKATLALRIAEAAALDLENTTTDAAASLWLES